MEVDWNDVIARLSQRIAQLEVELAVLQAAVDKYRPQEDEGQDETD